MLFRKNIPAEEFARRRQQFMDRIGPDAIALIPAAPCATRNRDVQYPYRQDSDFYYLTGFPEPEAVAVLVPDHAHPFHLFCRPRDPTLETWHGRRAGPEGAIERYGAHNAQPIHLMDEYVPTLLENRQRVFYAFGYNTAFDERVMRWLNQVRAKARTGVRAPHEFIALEHVLHDMRLHKTPNEIAVMREAARVAGEAHCQAMQTCRPGRWEYQIEAELMYVFLHEGGGWSYPPIVAGGANSCILHYVENNAQLHDGEVLLIDAGVEMDGYASDITRTFPINGRFSPEQRILYELVLAAQTAAIAQVQPGKPFNAFHDAAVQVLIEGLLDLGWLSGSVEELMVKEEHKRFYMHRTGHYLGLDVHDVGVYKRTDDWRIFEPGMVTTVEPGLYIPKGLSGVDERFWNIGIRIEDDVLVTESGHEILSHQTPKTISDIEALMRS